MPIPLDLACSLILLKGQQVDVYTVQDIVAASSTLKKFRDLQTVSAEPLAVPDLPLGFSSSSPRSMFEPEPLVTEPDYVAMSLDAKGSSQVQDLLETAGPETRLAIITQICRSLVPLAQHSHGCRVVQKALDVASLEERLALAASFPPGKVVDCCVDVNANHVMQKFIEVFTLDSSTAGFLDFFVDAICQPFTNTVARLSVHCYGCRVIQRLLARCLPHQKERVLDGIVSSVGEMVADQFGNYVAQHALEFGRETDRDRIIKVLSDRDLVMLSCNKFASNVVEKAVRLGDHSAGMLVLALSQLPDEQVLEIMRDRYGNYVIRAFLELSDGRLGRVRELVKDNSGSLKKFTYGWHLVEKLQTSSPLFGHRKRGRRNDENSNHPFGHC